jgi:hypothetical protein
VLQKIQLIWRRFPNIIDARNSFRNMSCIYAVTDANERVLRFGESGNFRKRYWGGDGWMLAAAMHRSGNLVFVAEAPKDMPTRRKVEALLTFQYQPRYSNQGKNSRPLDAPEVEHAGQIPRGIPLPTPMD